MAAAAVVSLERLREEAAHRDRRQALHEQFDRWLDEVEAAMGERPKTLEEITRAIWQRRQELTGRVAAAMSEEAQAEALGQTEMVCPGCQRVLRVRDQVERTVDTLVGPVRLTRPYFYCVRCQQGYSPADVALGLSERRKQWDLQQAAVELAAELPFARASELFEKLTGESFSDHVLHQVAQEVGDELDVLAISPSAAQIEACIAQVAQGRTWRPILVVVIDGAHVPTRPEAAKGKRAGRKRQRAKRARWEGQWREAKGFRFYLVDQERIVHLLSWHQVGSDEELAQALGQVQAAGLIPEEKVRLCVVADGARWIWNRVQTLFPSAVQILDYYHCTEHLYQLVQAQFPGDAVHQSEWVEATLARLFMGEVDQVLAQLQAMTAHDQAAAEEIRKLHGYLTAQHDRVHYGSLRKGGYPLGSGAIESANKTIGQVRLKRSGAWWYVENANHMLALRSALYNGTFEQVFQRYQQRLRSGHQPKHP